MSKKAIIGIIKTLLPLALGVYLIWVFYAKMAEDQKILDAFYKAIYEANYFWIIVSMLLGVVAYFARAYRWKYVLEPLGHKTKFWHRYHAVMIGYLMNLTIPRAGEASRSAMLFRSDGVPFSTSFGTIIAERAVDFVMLVSIALFTAFIGYSDFIEIKNLLLESNFGGDTTGKAAGFPWKSVIYSAILALGLVFCYFVVFKKKFRDKFLNFAKDVLKGLLSIFKLKQPLYYFLYTFVIWGCYVAMFALPFQSLHETTDVPFSGILLGFLAGSLGIMFTNGGIGSYPLLVGLTVAFYINKDYPDNPQAIGNALGTLVWVSQTILMILLGLISLFLLPNNFSKENEQIIEPEK